MKPKTRREAEAQITQAIIKVPLNNSIPEDKAKRRLKESRRVAR